MMDTRFFCAAACSVFCFLDDLGVAAQIRAVQPMTTAALATG